MMKKPKLYIDEEGVKRGYYVYLHKATETGKVFYVGKGSGGRAWKTNKRNNAWKEKVEQLNKQWEVEIYEDDLSELEAFGLEEKLVEEYGFFDDSNNQLTNRVPGGENPATILISFGSTEKPKWDVLYEKLRNFKEFVRQEKQEFAKCFFSQIDPLWTKVQELETEFEFPHSDVDEEEYHQPIYLAGILEESYVSAEEFLKNRISWQDFCLGIEYSYDGFQVKELKDDKTNRSKFSDECYKCYKDGSKVLNEAFEKIDSGNRNHTRALVNQKLSSLSPELSSKISYNSNCTKIITNKSLEETHQDIKDLLTSYGFEFTEESNSSDISTYFLKLGDSKKDIELRFDIKLSSYGEKVIATFKGYFRNPWLKKIMSLQHDDLRDLRAKWNKVKLPRLSFSVMTKFVSKLQYNNIEFDEVL